MNKYYYDLHIHSCLSPCADNDMTPNNIAGMASLKGLNIIALTDHNSAKNCPAFFEAAKKYGIVPVAGMEMTTAEDIHMVCLFPDLESAMTFDEMYQQYRILYPNKKEIFGDQLILDKDDNVVGEEENLLINASTLSLEEAAAIVNSFGGVAFPAHIDREENGIVASLGCVPDSPKFSCIEFNDSANIEEYKEKYNLYGKRVLSDSDAHYLENINEAENYIMLEDEPYSSALVRRKLIEYLKSDEGTVT